VKIIKIAVKSIWRHNLGSKTFFAAVTLLLILPSLFYGISGSIGKKLQNSQREVYGGFSDILYTDRVNTDNMDAPDKEIDDFFAVFNTYESGTIYTVYSEEISERRKLNVGYSDETAVILSGVNFIAGKMPQNVGEVALTESAADYLGAKNIGDKAIIAGNEYAVCGILYDYGRLWVRGAEQDEKNISPVNTFLTRGDAEKLLAETNSLTRQVLAKQIGGSNAILSGGRHFANSRLSGSVNFSVPKQFMAIMFVIFAAMVLSVLALNSKQLQKRASTYYRLGANPSEAAWIIRAELLILFIAGIITALFFSICLNNIIVFFISKYINISIAPSFDWGAFLLLTAVLFAVIFAIITVFGKLQSGKAVKTVQAVNVKKLNKIKFKNRFTVGKFALKYHKGSMAMMILLAVCLYTIIGYAVFYGNYYKRTDFLEGPKGSLARDYDFQFVTQLMNAAPWQDYDDPIIFFTSNYEKMGAKQDFIDKLTADKMVKSVKAYRENNKYYTLLKDRQIDEYIDKINPVHISGTGYNSRKFNDFSVVGEKFGYSNDDILVPSDVLGYPDDVLETLSGSVVDGRIDMEKIKSGEEIILRVPDYELSSIEGGVMFDMYTPDKNGDYYSSTALKAGDEITLTGLFADEPINGAVPQSYLEKYRREDITVKIGAIIRNTDGMIYQRGSMQQTYSFLTVNSAFETLGIAADYSIVSVYAADGYSDETLATHFTEYLPQTGNMSLENWLTDVKTYKIYNTLIFIFVTSLIVVLAVTALIIISSHLLTVTKHSAANYALLRINGLPLKHILLIICVGAPIAAVIGGIIGVPISLAVIALFGIGNSPFGIGTELIYYFPPRNLAYIFALIFSVSVIAVIPSLAAVWRGRDDVLTAE